MQQVYGFFDMLQQFVNGNPLYILVWAAGILLLINLKKKERYIAALAFLILILGIFNPISYQMLIEKTGRTAEYYRFLWLIPYAALLAYLVYAAFNSIKNNIYRLIIVSAVCIITLCGRIKAEDLKLPDNAYQIPDEVVEVAVQLEELMEMHGETNAVILSDYYISNIIRQYDANICLPFYGYDISVGPNLQSKDMYGLISMLIYNENDMPQDAIEMIVEGNQIAYLVLPKGNDVSIAYMQQMGWEIAGETSGYYILNKQQSGSETEPPYSDDIWTDFGISTEEVSIHIPGLKNEYIFLWMSDLHIVTENNEIVAEDLETVAGRRESFKNAVGMYSDDYWLQLSDVLDTWGVDAFFFGGDMIDHAANANIACLKQGLDGLETPYLYVRADHDYAPYYCEVQDMDAVAALHAGIDGYEEVSLIEFDDLCIVGINNSTMQLTETGLQKFKDIYAKGKPIILVTHVPLNSLCDTSLEEQSKEMWGDRALVWGEDCTYKPDGITQEFLDMVYAKDSQVKEVLGGHLHFSWDGKLTEYTDQHVFAPSYTGNIGVVRVGE